jgi:DNA-binding NarL/FixJ family response regulator
MTTNDLTRRQLETVRHVMEGKLNKEIAEDMNLTERTVKRHLEDTYKKFGWYGNGSRYKLMAWAFHNNLAA